LVAVLRVIVKFVGEQSREKDFWGKKNSKKKGRRQKKLGKLGNDEKDSRVCTGNEMKKCMRRWRQQSKLERMEK